MDKAAKLGIEPIGKLLVKLSVPATIGMMVILLYQAADMFFVGQGVGKLGIAGIAVVFPIQMLIGAFGQLIGIGGSSIISRSLGAKDLAKAHKTFTIIVIINVLLSSVIATLCYLFMDQVLFTFGAHNDVLIAARDYFSYLVIGSPMLSLLMMGNNVLRSEGCAKESMYIMLTTAIFNILLDPLFIFVLDMGIAGAAIATVISQILSLFYMLYVYSSGKSVLRFQLSLFSFDWKLLKETFAVGSSSFARQGGTSAMTAVINHKLYLYGGDTAIAAFGLVSPIIRFVLFPLIGLVQGSLPIIGYNYGAKNFGRVKDTLRKSNIAGSLIATTLFVILMLFSQETIAFFSTDKDLTSLASHALRILALFLPFVGFQMLTAGYFQALGKALPSFILSSARQVWISLPLILVFPYIWGLDGVWYAFPVADFLSIILSFFYIVPQIKLLRKKEKSS